MHVLQSTDLTYQSRCLYEWDHTLHFHGPDGLHMQVSVEGARILDLGQSKCLTASMQGMDTDALTAIVDRVDVMKAKCFKKEDHTMMKIFRSLEKQGDIPYMDKMC